MYSDTNSLSRELALSAATHFNEIQANPAVTHSPGTLGKILMVVEDIEDVKQEYDRARFSFSHAVLASATDAVQSREPDAILVSVEMQHREEQHFNKLRSIANERSIPLILYSS